MPSQFFISFPINYNAHSLSLTRSCSLSSTSPTHWGRKNGTYQLAGVTLPWISSLVANQYTQRRECIQHHVTWENVCLKCQGLQPAWESFPNLNLQYHQDLHYTQWEQALQQLQCCLPAVNNHSFGLLQQKLFLWKTYLILCRNLITLYMAVSPSKLTTSCLQPLQNFPGLPRPSLVRTWRNI